MTHDEIRQAAEDRLKEVDAQLAALAAERVRLRRMLGQEDAPPAPTWSYPRVPLPDERWSATTMDVTVTFSATDIERAMREDTGLAAVLLEPLNGCAPGAFG